MDEVVINIRQSEQILENSLSCSHKMQTGVHLINAYNHCDEGDGSAAMATYKAALNSSHKRKYCLFYRTL